MFTRKFNSVSVRVSKSKLTHTVFTVNLLKLFNSFLAVVSQLWVKRKLAIQCMQA